MKEEWVRHQTKNMTLQLQEALETKKIKLANDEHMFDTYDWHQ